MKLSLTTLACVLTLLCSAQRKENIYAHFGNLVGTWEMKTSDASLFEEWKIVNDSTLEGKSWKVEKGKTTNLEDVQLVWRNGKYHYGARAYGQNEDQRIVFAQSELSSTKEMVSGKQAHSTVNIVFADPTHDYPQYIKYSMTQGSLVAKVGNDANFADCQTYKYVRAK